jgi:hypothetical protein
MRDTVLQALDRRSVAKGEVATIPVIARLDVVERIGNGFGRASPTNSDSPISVISARMGDGIARIGGK